MRYEKNVKNPYFSCSDALIVVNYLHMTTRWLGRYRRPKKDKVKDTTLDMITVLNID